MANLPDESAQIAIPEAKPLKITRGWEILASKVSGYNTAVVMGAARARTGLLLSVLNKLQEFDPMTNVDAASVKTLEDHATFSLLVRLHKNPSLKLTELPKELGDFAQKTPEGWMMPIDKLVKMEVEGADRPALLRDICEILDTEKIDVKDLDTDISVKFPKNTEDFSGGTPMARLTLGLYLPREAVQNMEAIRTRLAGLGLDVRME